MMTMRQILVTLAFVVMLTCGARAGATRPLDTITLDCAFMPQSTIDIAKGVMTKGNSEKKSISFTISGLDEKNGRAIMVGDAGSTPLQFFSDTMRWVFVEITQTGNVMVTSMTAPSASGETIAVHSRHAWILGSGLISQWVGTCESR